MPSRAFVGLGKIWLEDRVRASSDPKLLFPAARVAGMRSGCGDAEVPGFISGGESQMLAISCALICQPDVWA